MEQTRKRYRREEDTESQADADDRCESVCSATRCVQPFTQLKPQYSTQAVALSPADVPVRLQIRGVCAYQEAQGTGRTGTACQSKLVCSGSGNPSLDLAPVSDKPSLSTCRPLSCQVKNTHWLR